MSSVDVLVVGAGPTGLMLASELLRYGLSVRVIDKASAPTTLSKAIAVHARTLEVLESVGVAQRLVDRGLPLIGATLLAGGETIARVEFEDLCDATRFPFVLSVSQAETEAVLAEVLHERGGIVERERELRGVEEIDGAVIATVRRVGTEEEETIRAAWVAGCDGAHSTVRKAAKATFEGHSYDEVFVLGDVKVAGDLSRERITSFFADDGIAACFPMKHDRVRVIVTATPEIAAGATPTLETLEAIVSRRAGSKLVLSDCTWIAPFRIHCRQVEAYRYGRLLLAGDAAHIHSPAGGQGMNTGIQDAHNLAWKLALFHRGAAHEALLDSYGAERHAVGQAVLRATDVATKVGTLRGLVATSIRNQIARFATSFDHVRTRIATSLSELDVAYEGSPIVGEHTGSLGALRIGDAASGETPTVGSRFAFRDGPHPGAWAPNAAELADPEAFSILLFDGRSASTEGYERLASIARRATERWGARVKSVLVTPHESVASAASAASAASSAPSDLVVRHDTDGALERKYAATTECLYVVRPDLYVSFRSQPADESALFAHLESLLR